MKYSFRRAIAAAACLALSATTAFAATGGAEQGPAAPATVTAPESRPDNGSASIAAKQSGQPVEVTGATTETTRRWANPDGTFNDEVAAGPVRTRRNGGWVPIDTALATRDGAVRPGATMGDVAFSAGGDTALASVSDGHHGVGLTWPKPLPAPVVSGNTARYADVSPGVDLVLTALPAGFEQSFVLKTRAAASTAHLSLPLGLSGLAPVARNGEIALRSADGAERAWVGSARMWDATGRTAPVGVAVRGTGHGRTLDMTPDAAMLADPALKFPVTVDPLVQIFRYRDAYIDSVNIDTNYGSNAYLKIGKRSTITYVSYLQFDMSAYTGKKIVDAYMYLGTVDSLTCSAKTTTIYPVTNGWTQAAVTWRTHPVTDLGVVLDTATSAGGGPTGSSCAANAWMTFHSSTLTAKYQAWADSPSANYGVSIRSDAADSLAAKDFASGENSSWTPRTNITWDNYPATVTGRSLTPQKVYGTTNYVASVTPKFGGVSTDPDGGTTRIDFEIWNSAMTSMVASGSTPYVTQGTSAYWTLPTANALTSGTTYQMRARGYDGSTWSKSYSAWYPFTVDTTAPAAATVSSTAYPAGQWSGSDGQSGSFTFSPNGATDVDGYYYWLDGAASTFVSGTGSTSVSLAPSEGPHVLSVQSADHAGNRAAVTTYAFSVGQLSIASPTEGDRVAETVSLDAQVRPAQWTSLEWQWRRSAVDTWVSVTTLTRTDTSQAFGAYSWNAGTAIGADGPFQLRAVVSDGTTTSASKTRSLTLARGDFATVSASTQVGPATVNLQSGNARINETDVVFDGGAGTDLSVGRTFNSRAAAASPQGPFGPGWLASLPVADATYTTLSPSGALVTVTKADGDTIGFVQSATAGEYVAEYDETGLTLTHVTAGGADTYRLEELGGDVTTFTKPTTNSVDYVPTSLVVNGDSGETVAAYEVVLIGGVYVTRPTALMARPATGVTGCDVTTPTAVRGCRSLKLTYAASGTTPPASGQSGPYANRLVKVEAIAYDPEAVPAAMRTVEIQDYAYDSSGRLVSAWDPRISPALTTRYTYNTYGQIATVTPPGDEAWTFAYGDRGSESNAGRLRSVSRPTLSTPSTGTTTIVYGVPVSGTGAPWNLSSTELDKTGQADRPTMATAVFPANTTSTLGADPNSLPTGTTPWDRATVVYMNADGREVNKADPNGGITTTENDAFGNVVRTLSAANRARVVNSGGTTSEQAAMAEALSERTVYAADGIEIAESFGPEREVVLSTGEHVRARAHVTSTYDEGAPSGGPYHLSTTTAVSARVAGETADRASETRISKKEYGTTEQSWGLAMATATFVDAGTGGLNLATRATYTSDGRILTQTLPSGGTATTTAATRTYVYYTAGTNTADAACGGRPEWADQLCAVVPGGQPATGPSLPSSYTTLYTMFDRPRTVEEKVGATTLRTITTTYDAAGRTLRSSVTASTGVAVPTVENVYGAGGRITRTNSLDTSSNVLSYVERTYDTLGRLTAYRDSTGATSTTTYDLMGRPSVVNDGKGTQTFAYDAGAERRGLATSLVDSHAGTFTATYDVGGTPTVVWPNGLTQVLTTDESGTTTGLDYVLTSCSTDCTQLAFANASSVHGQVRERSSTLSSQVYRYDGAGRLSQAADTVNGVCTTRAYVYDADGNRTQLTEYGPDTDGVSCQTTTGSTPVITPHDAADRVTTSGTVYDALGRTITVPDADALDSGDLTVTYHANDVVRSIARAGGSTNIYTLDVDRLRVLSWTDGTTTRTNHYTKDGDSPAWTQESTTAWTRNVRGLTGSLAGTYDSAAAATTLSLHDLHGDVAATTSASSPTLTPLPGSSEFGAPRGATGARYGWLGAQQRASDTPGGLTLMGMRLYNPQTGRFLQVDPVYGGSANAYDYVNQDPVNGFDLNGSCPCKYTVTYYRLLKYGSVYAWGGWVCAGSYTACQNPKAYMGSAPVRVDVYSLCGYGCFTDIWAKLNGHDRVQNFGIRMSFTFWFSGGAPNLVQYLEVWSWAAPWYQYYGIYRTLFRFAAYAKITYSYWA